MNNLPEITVTVPRVLAKHFLTLAEYLSDRLSCAGCNDFPVDDTPENRLLEAIIHAQNEGKPVEEWLADPRRHKAAPHNGKFYLMDWMVFDLFVERVKAVEAASSLLTKDQEA